MLINKNKKTSGFAMIELLVYLGIFGVVVAMLTGILTSITKTQVQESAQNDVAGQLNFAMQTIQRLIKTSSIVNSEIGVATSTLSLIMPDSTYNPTQIYSSNGTLYIKQGNNASQSITSNKVRVDILEFKRLVQAGARDVVQIDLVLSGVAEVEGKILTRALRSAVSRASAVTFDSDLLPAVDNSYNVGASPATRWKDGAYSGNLTVGGSATAGSFCLSGNCITTWTSGGGGTWGSITGTLSSQTDLQSALDAKIPYTGGTTNVNLGLHNLTVDTNSLFVDSTNHTVGFGTTSPITGANTLGTFQKDQNTYSFLNVINRNTGASARVGLSLQIADSGHSIGFQATSPAFTLGVGYEQWRPNAMIVSVGSQMSGGLSFFTNNASAPITFGTVSGAAANERMRISETGNVGIGTTAPGNLLSITRASGVSGTIPALGVNGGGLGVFDDAQKYGLILGSNGTGNSFIQAQRVDGTATAYDLLLQPSGGNVGIGTTVPGAKLDIFDATGSDATASQFTVRGVQGAGQPGFMFERSDGTPKFINMWTGSGGAVLAFTNTSSRLAIGTNTYANRYSASFPTTEIMSLLPSGNVGIGTTAPTAKLEVDGNSTVFYGVGTGSSATTFYLQNTNATFDNSLIYGPVSRAASSAYNFIDMRANGVQQFVVRGDGQVTTTGNVGIGTTTPDTNYKITTSAGGIKAESTTQPAGYFNSSSGYGLLVNTGNVGIGTVTPAYKLDVAGVIHTNNDVYISDATKGIILKDSVDASCSRVTLASGNLTTAKITCP